MFGYIVFYRIRQQFNFAELKKSNTAKYDAMGHGNLANYLASNRQDLAGRRDLAVRQDLAARQFLFKIRVRVN